MRAAGPVTNAREFASATAGVGESAQVIRSDMPERNTVSFRAAPMLTGE